MGKRACPAVEPAARKEAKVPADPFLEELAPVLALLGQSGDSLSGSCREMLQALAPSCLRSPVDERHPYQTTMADALEKVLVGFEVEHQAAVDAAQGQLAEAEIEQANAASHLATATEKAEQQRKEKDGKEATCAELGSAAEAAASAVAQECERQQSLSSEQSQVLSDKDEAQKFLTEKFEPLKAGTFEGKQWRERNKAIDSTLQMLGRMGLDSSLKASLPTALKTKPAERGKFATKAVEFSEVVANQFLVTLDEKIANFAQEAAARAQAVSSAEEALQTAQRQLEESTAAAQAAQESLDDASMVVVEAEACMKSNPKVVGKCTCALEQERASLAHVQGVLEVFRTLKERSATTKDASVVEDVAVQEVEAATQQSEQTSTTTVQ